MPDVADISHFTLNDLAPYFEGAFLGATMQDWIQTTRFLRDGQNELNPLLGPHPSQAKMSGFGIGMDALQYAGYAALPDGWKLPYAALSAGIEGLNVYRNKKVTGYPLDIPALGLGGLVTAALVADYNKEHKNKVRMDVNKINRTYVPMVTWEW